MLAARLSTVWQRVESLDQSMVSNLMNINTWKQTHREHHQMSQLQLRQVEDRVKRTVYPRYRSDGECPPSISLGSSYTRPFHVEFFSSRHCLKAMNNSFIVEDQIIDIGFNFS